MADPKLAAAIREAEEVCRRLFGSPAHVELWAAIHEFDEARRVPDRERAVVRVETALAGCIAAAALPAEGEARGQRISVCAWCGSALSPDPDAPHRWRCHNSTRGVCVARGYWYLLADDLDYAPAPQHAPGAFAPPALVWANAEDAANGEAPAPQPAPSTDPWTACGCPNPNDCEHVFYEPAPQHTPTLPPEVEAAAEKARVARTDPRLTCTTSYVKAEAQLVLLAAVDDLLAALKGNANG